MLTPSQYATYQSWGEGDRKNDVLRELITMRAMGQDETKRRIAEISRDMADLGREKDRLQATLEDILGPIQEKADAIAQRYFEESLFNMPHEMQRGRIDGYAGQDDSLAARAWDILRERGGWGGD